MTSQGDDITSDDVTYDDVLHDDATCDDVLHYDFTCDDAMCDHVMYDDVTCDDVKREKVSSILDQAKRQNGNTNIRRPRWASFIIKDRLAIAIRSLKDRCVTIVSLTQVLV